MDAPSHDLRVRLARPLFDRWILVNAFFAWSAGVPRRNARDVLLGAWDRRSARESPSVRSTTIVKSTCTERESASIGPTYFHRRI